MYNVFKQYDGTEADMRDNYATKPVILSIANPEYCTPSVSLVTVPPEYSGDTLISMLYI